MRLGRIARLDPASLSSGHHLKESGGESNEESTSFSVARPHVRPRRQCAGTGARYPPARRLRNAYFGKVTPQMIPAILLCFALLSFGQGPDGQGRRQQGQGQPPSGQQPTATTQTTGAPTGGQTGQARPPQDRRSAVQDEVPVITHPEI